MAIDNKNLLTAVKAFARANQLPLDSSEVWESFDLAESYAQSPIAYPGQTIKVLIGEKYKVYVLQPSVSGGLTLEEIKEGGGSGVSNPVRILEELPSAGEQGIIYIVGQSGYIWTGSAFKQIFTDATFVEAQIQVALDERLGEIPKNTTVKDYIDLAVSSGGVDVADAIEAAKIEAISVSENYTDVALTIQEF